MRDADARDMWRLGDDVRHFAFVLLARHRPGPIDAEVARRFRVKLRLAFHRRIEVDDRGQFLVLDLDQVSRIERRSGVLGYHHGHRIADVHHLLAGEYGTERNDRLYTAAAGDRGVT